MIKIFTSIEFSSALLGAIVGGFFTWLATWYTMRKQKKLDEEQRRIDHMPLLRLTIKPMLSEECDFSVLGVQDGELLTTVNPDMDTLYGFLCVSPDSAAVFNFRVAEVYVEPYGVMKKSAAYAPLPMQLLPKEEEIILFNFLDEINCNIDVVIRFEYEDVFGHVYVQDAFFQYFEAEYDGREHKILEKREIYQPQLKKKYNGKERRIKSLEEIVKREMRGD